MLRRCDYAALRLRSGKVTENQIDKFAQRKGLEDQGHEGVGAAPAHSDSAAAAAAGVPPPHPAPSTNVPQTVMSPSGNA